MIALPARSTLGSIPANRCYPLESALPEESTMDKDDIIATLNNLIETSRDGEQGFRTCADGVKNPQLKQMFERAASRCAQAVSELQAKVRSLGGDPENRGSVSGSLHRGWVNIKSTITGMDEAAVLAECERGEDVAKTAYEDALKKDLPADVRSMIEREYEGVKQHHDRVRQLRNAAT
jgi:uncharacterized protein (TIGR02284 family)